MGFQEIDLHNVNLKQEQFIEVFAEKVLPELKPFIWEKQFLS
jgi:hypothetical protein